MWTGGEWPGAGPGTTTVPVSDAAMYAPGIGGPAKDWESPDA